MLHFTKGLALREVESKPGEFVDGSELDTELSGNVQKRSQVTLRPEGLLWFATQKSLSEQLQKAAAKHSDKDIVIDLSDLIALDVTTIESLAELAKSISPRRLGVYDSPWDSNDVVLAAVARETA